LVILWIFYPQILFIYDQSRSIGFSWLE
jgi:hypothetical protein